MAKLRVASPQQTRQPLSPFKAALQFKNTPPVRHKGSSGHFTRRGLPHVSATFKEDSKTLGRPSDRHDFDQDEDTFCDADTDAQELQAYDNIDEIQDDEDALFYWEEENTLLSELMDSPVEEYKEHDLDELAESLQPCFDQRGRELKKEIAETLVPTVNRVKALYKKIDTEADEEYGKGLLAFNKACKDFEALAIRDEDDFRHTWHTTKTKIDDLVSQLRDAYKARERLWTEFEAAFDNIAKPVLNTLRETPANVERAIANLEKHAKALEKDDSTSANTAEKNIMEMLRKTL